MPSLITASADGTVWFTLNQAHAIGRITPAGEITIYPLPTTGAAPVGIHAAGRPYGSPKSALGRSDASFPAGGSKSSRCRFSCRPHAIAADDEGGCWVTLWAASSVVRLDVKGRLAEEISFQAGAEPHGLALAPDGTPWVALEAGLLAHLTTT